MENFKKIYRDLEVNVISRLRDIINDPDNNYKSMYHDIPSVKIYHIEYEELSIVNDKLVFIDYRGLHYSFFNHDLEDSIDILEKLLKLKQ